MSRETSVPSVRNPSSSCVCARDEFPPAFGMIKWLWSIGREIKCENIANTFPYWVRLIVIKVWCYGVRIRDIIEKLARIRKWCDFTPLSCKKQDELLSTKHNQMAVVVQWKNVHKHERTSEEKTNDRKVFFFLLIFFFFFSPGIEFLSPVFLSRKKIVHIRWCSGSLASREVVCVSYDKKNRPDFFFSFSLSGPRCQSLPTQKITSNRNWLSTDM